MGPRTETTAPAPEAAVQQLEARSGASAQEYVRLQFQIRPQSGASAELSAKMVRRVLGKALVDRYCAVGETVCQPSREEALSQAPKIPIGRRCTLAGCCPYGVLFAASLTVRPPYTLYLHRPPGAGAALFLEITLLGPAWRMYPWVARALEAALLRGVDKDRRKWEIQSVFRSGAGRERHRLCGGDLAALPMALEPDRLAPPSAWVAAEVGGVPSPATGRVQVDLLSPTRLIADSRLLADGEPVPFRLLVARTFGRYYDLFGQPADWAAERARLQQWVQEAEAVPLLEDRTRRRRVNDYSARWQREINLDGRVGSLLYGPEAARFLPVLRLAEILHIGKNPASGCGRVRAELLPAG
jgi:hypothetical protein